MPHTLSFDRAVRSGWPCGPHIGRGVFGTRSSSASRAGTVRTLRTRLLFGSVGRTSDGLPYRVWLVMPRNFRISARARGYSHSESVKEGYDMPIGLRGDGGYRASHERRCVTPGRPPDDAAGEVCGLPGVGGRDQSQPVAILGEIARTIACRDRSVLIGS